ncbi:MAG: DsbA family protein [Gemmatimonadota bacterium]|nr:DsbA family protein [Gemmatimonadota bacterium]
MNPSAVRVICGIVLVNLLPWLHGHAAEDSGGEAGRARAGDAGSPVKVELFVMAHCPYGMRAEAALAPTVRAFGDGIDFRLHFIAQEAGKEPVSAGPLRPLRPLRSHGESCESGAVSGTGRFLSLHGDAEVEEGIRQVVMMHLYPDRFYDYILDRNENMASPDWQTSAGRAGIDAERVAEFTSGAKGETLFSENIRRSNQLGVRASPTLYVNGVEVKGGIETHGLARRICGLDSLAGPCASVPVCGADRDCVSAGRVGVCVDPGKPAASCRFSDPVVFRMTVLNDTQCDLCDPALFVRSTRELFPGVDVQTLNVHSRQGRKLADRFRVDRVPAFILDDDFAKTARFQRFAKAVYPIRGSFMPRPVLVPVSRLMGRKADPGRMDFFFAGTSPATVRIVGDLASWLDAVDARERLRLHPMGQDENAFSGLCVRQIHPDRYRAFAMCVFRGASKRGISEAYAACMKQQAIDVERIRRCAAADGAALAARSRVSARRAGIDPSMNPSLLLDGRFVVTSRMLPQARDLFYRLNPELQDRDRTYMEQKKK